MENKTAIFFIVLIILSNISIAEETINTKVLLNSINDLKKYEGKELPGLLAFLFGSKVIEISILMNDRTTEYITIEVSGSMIKKICRCRGTPNILINISENILDQILKSENPLLALLGFYKGGHIGLNAIGFGTKIKLFLFKIFVRIGLLVQSKIEIKETAGSFKCPLSCPTGITNTDFGQAITCKVKEELQDREFSGSCSGTYENSPREFRQCSCEAVRVTSNPCPSDCTLSNGDLCVLTGTIGAKNIGKSNVACVGQTKWREGKPNIMSCLCS
ncbi:hypothetical protein HYX16_03365 [Candidatus Woesearchaeota archaeon]|nr:hypothetical protein [Candidatus Woesearchaeota archaeon]